MKDDVLFNKTSWTAEWLDRMASTREEKTFTTGEVWKQLICFHFEWRDQVHKLDLNPHFWKNLVCCVIMQRPVFFQFCSNFLPKQFAFLFTSDDQIWRYSDNIKVHKHWRILFHQDMCSTYVTLSNMSWLGQL